MRICKNNKLPWIRADYSFFLFIALLFLYRDSRCVLNVFVVCGLHEWGHLAVMYLFGVRISEIRLSGFGIRIITRKSGAEPILKSLAVLLAGPLVNILMYILLTDKIHDTAVMSLGAGIYNLLPYSQLDGGAMLELLILGNIHERRLRKMLKLLRTGIIAAAALLTFIYGIEAVPILIAVTFLYIGNECVRRV